MIGAATMAFAATSLLVMLDDPSVDGEQSRPGFLVAANSASQEARSSESVASPVGAGSERYELEPVCGTTAAATCFAEMECGDQGTLYSVFLVDETGRRGPEQGQVCVGEPRGMSEPQAPVQVTQAMVLRALRRVEVPAVRVRVQPPGGKTLVNLETIFSAEAAAFERTVRLLGRRVDLVVRPVRFRWSHGDGTSQQSASAGVAYRRDRDPDGYITHRYLRVAKVQVGVEVDFAARFRVDGGRWQDVDGVVTVASAPQALQVVEARPTLVTP